MSNKRITACCFPLLGLASYFLPPSTFAQCADWRARGVGLHLNGIVYDTTVWDADGPGPQPPMLVAAGFFSKAGGLDGIAANNIAAWDGQTWHAIGNGLGDTFEAVHALAVYNGELIAAGTFTTSGGAAVNRIARWNGVAWRPLGDGIDGGTNCAVYALEVFNGELIAGGVFSVAGGHSANSIASWNGAAWSPLADGIQLAGDFGVRALAVFNGQLYAGGGFAFAGSEIAFNIARWNGAWSPIGDIFGDQSITLVNALTVFNNQLIAGGIFSQAGNANARNIARYNGTTWAALGSGIAGLPLDGVIDLEVFNNELIATGEFNNAGGTGVSDIARWDGNVWRSMSGGVFTTGEALTVFNNELIAGGWFTQAGDRIVSSIARWTGSAWREIPGLLRPSGEFGVRTITPWADSVVLGGSYSTTDTHGTFGSRALTAWDGVSLRSLGNPNSFVFASCAVPAAGQTSDLIIGGQFDRIDGEFLAHIARRNSAPNSTWQPMGAGFNNDVLAITQFNGDIYAAGDFTQSGGVLTHRIARWNGSAWVQVGPPPITGLNGSATCMKGYASGPNTQSLVVGGSFTNAGGVPANRVASFNVNTQTQATNWSAMGNGFNGVVRAVEFFNGSIYAAGDFTASGTTQLNYIARWNGSAWEPVGGGLSNPAHALAVSNNSLIVGGYFTEAGGMQIDRLARWDGQAWSEVGGGVDDAVYALCTIDNELHVGGEFTHVRNRVLESPLWARYSEDGVPWFARQPGSIQRQCRDVATFAAFPALGYGGLTFQWRKDSVPVVLGPTGTGSTITTNGVTLNIQNAGLADEGAYDCVMSNGCGSSVSNTVTLTVENCCITDLDGDGITALQDLAILLSHFGTTGAPVWLGDLDDDGVVGLQDMAILLSRFGESCEIAP